MTVTLTAASFRLISLAAISRVPRDDWTATIRATPSAATPPWHALSPGDRVFRDAVSNWIATHESQGNHGLVAQQIRTFMLISLNQAPAIKRTKSEVLDVLLSSNLLHYMPFTAEALRTPGTTNATLKSRILIGLQVYSRITRPNPLPDQLVRHLDAFRDDAVLSTPEERIVVQQVLNRE